MELSNKQAAEYIQAKITAALTIAGKLVETRAKQNCPVDTGRLRDSIESDVVDDETVRIGTNTEYAPYVELGTKRQSPNPFLRNALTETENDINKIFKDIFNT